MEILKIALDNFEKRSAASKQKGKRLDRKQINIIQESMGMKLPNWYVDMMLNHDLTDIMFEYLEYDNEKSGISISSYNTILSEINDAYPGLGIKSMGYINFGECLQGSGDPIFINLKENDNPPVIRVYHDGTIENGIIDKNGGNKLADNLSDFLNKAEFDNFL